MRTERQRLIMMVLTKSQDSSIVATFAIAVARDMTIKMLNITTI